MVDLQLKENTAHRHMQRIEALLNNAEKPISTITKEDLRNYLLRIKENCDPYTYKNHLGSLKRFFRDFMNRKGLVETFQFPKIPFELKTAPSIDELRKFYEALETDRDRALFLLYATTGLRESELVNLERENIDFEKRMIIPNKLPNETKHTYVTFYNEEAERILRKYLSTCNNDGAKLFTIKRKSVNKMFKRTAKKCGIRITPKMLRDWFCNQMGELGVQDRYIDAFCGRVPKSILARHYTDYSPNRLKRIYDKAELKVLSWRLKMNITVLPYKRAQKWYKTKKPYPCYY